MSLIEYEFSAAIEEVTGKGQGSVLVLHGYMQSGFSILRQLPVLKAHYAKIYAPNGPFPIPYKREENWRMGYGWYFYDQIKGKYVVGMSHAVQGISRFIGNLSEPSVDLIGYSQGGYLAPFVADVCPKVPRIFGLNCRIRLMQYQRDFTYLAIHAREDEVIDFAESKKSFEQALNCGLTGEWTTVEGGHKIGPSIAEALDRLLKRERGS